MLGKIIKWRYTPLVTLAIILLVVPVLAPTDYYLRVAALVWVFALAALGLTVLTGFAGQVSLGQAGFMGLGAYGVAIGPAHLGIPPLPSLILSVILSAVIAFLVGKPILRLKGYYLAIATLGFGLILGLVFTSERAWTGGPDGMSVERIVIFGWRVAGASTWYWVTGVIMLLGAWLVVNLAASPSGRALRALHDSEVAAASVGVDVAQKKLLAFVIAGAYGALAGGLLALMNSFITPDVAGFMHSIELVAMVIIGGLGSVFGAVIGAAFLIVLPQVLTAVQEYEHAVLGLLIMVFMILLPAGIVPTIRRLIEERLK